MTQTKSNYKVGRLIIVDDEIELMTALCEILTRHGYETAGYTSGAEALAKLKEQDFDLLLTDLMMPEMGGIELLQAAREIDPDIVGIVMTGQGTVQTAVEAMKTGALDYIMKPFKLNGLLPVLSRAMEVRHLRTENMQLRETVAMHELGQALAFSSDLNQILNKVTDAVLQQCDADEASIMLPTSDGKELIIAVARGGHAEYIGKRISMGQGIAGWVAQNREPVTLNGEVHDERFASINPRSDISTAVSIPMIVGGSLIGVLNVNITRPHRPFTLGQVKTLIMLATIVSPILENARLYAEKRRAEDLYKTLAECSLAAVFIVQDGKFRFINAAVTSLGYSAEELIGRHSDTIIHPEDREMVKKRGGEMLRGEHTAPYEFRTVTKQGQIRWLMQIVSPILYEGRPAVLGNAIDVTERKKAEEALRRSEEEYRNIFDNILEGIYRTTPAGRFLILNPALARICGYASPEEMTKKVTDIANQLYANREDRLRFQKFMAAEGEVKGFDVQFKHPTKGLVWVSINSKALRDGQGNIQYYDGTIEDITERKQAEEALRESEEKYRNILENMNDSYFETDLRGTMTFCNPMVSKSLGYSPEEMAGMNHRTYMDLENAEIVERNFQGVYRENIPSKLISYEVTKKDGTKAHIETSVSLIKNKDGRPVGYRGMSRDITERERAEEALRESEEKYRALVETTDTGFVIIDGNGTVLDANENYIKMTGRKTLDEIRNRNVIEWTSQHDLERNAQAIKKCFDQGFIRDLEVNYVSKEGDNTPVEISATLVETNEGKRILSLCRDITGRKQAEEALRIQNQTFSEVLNGLDSLVYVIDMKTYEIVFINTYGQNIWGDIKGKICWQTIQEGQASPCEFCTNSQIIGPDGNPTKGVVWQFQNTVTKRWYDCRDKAIYWPDGRIVRMEIATDITENKQVEEALRSSEQQLSDIIEFLPDATLIIDKEGKVIAWNRAIEEMTGVKAEDMLGKGDYEYAIPFYGERRPILIDLALHPKPEMEISYNHIERKGDIIFGEAFAPGLAGCKTHLTATASVLRDAGGEIILAIECFRNNTERRRAQEDLRHAEERYRSIFDNAQEGIFQTTYEGQYLAANRALATILGYDSPEELMTTVTDITTQLYVDPEVRKALLKMIEEQGPVKGFETQFYRKDGSIIWVSVNQHAVRDAGGRVLHYEGFNDDITIKKGNVERMKKALWATVQAIAVTVETRDPYTAGHQRRVADLARAIAMEMNIPTDQIDGILMAAIIHDIGKISVPAEILSKPSKLTDLEFGIIKTHAQSGYDILKDIEFPWPIARMVLEHHERMDGSGYPRNLNGDDILMEARILAVSDVVEAMGSHRPYRPSRGIDAALEEIENKRGTHYDTGVVDACLRIFRGNGYHLEGTSF